VHRDDTSGLGNLPVLHPTGVDLGAFLYRNPNPIRVELGLDEDFVFHPWVHLETQKISKSKRNLKKTRNLKKIEPPPEKNLKRNSFTKPDRQPNPIQNLTDSDSSAKFYPRVRIQVSNSTRVIFYRADFRST
jgi:hypothetical protein